MAKAEALDQTARQDSYDMACVLRAQHVLQERHSSKDENHQVVHYRQRQVVFYFLCERQANRANADYRGGGCLRGRGCGDMVAAQRSNHTPLTNGSQQEQREKTNELKYKADFFAL